MRELQLRDAKASFSAVVEQAERGEETVVTRHGQPTAVILGYADWLRLKGAQPSFADLLLDFPDIGEIDGTRHRRVIPAYDGRLSARHKCHFGHRAGSTSRAGGFEGVGARGLLGTSNTFSYPSYPSLKSQPASARGKEMAQPDMPRNWRPG
jgi:antitoxin Phd